MIGIIGFESLHVMQYLDKYTKILDTNKRDYQVVYWNRTGRQNPDSRYLPYQEKMDTYVPFRAKIKQFLGYARFLYRTIRSGQYDRLIILTSQTAVVLAPLLLTKYRNKYLYDYRDITFERNRLYRFLIRRLFRHSFGTPISSLGFTEIVGDSDKIYLSHNTQDFEKKIIPKTPSVPIRIVYWGMVRQVAFNRKICDLFGNDVRFTLTYHGEGFYREIEQHCLEKGYRNIRFTGGYDRQNLYQFISETDILLNAYENDTQQKPALTVKLYDGMRYERPQLVTAGSYMAEFLKDKKIAYPLALDHPDSKTEILKWYHTLSPIDISNDYKKMRQAMLKDEAAFARLVKAFIATNVISLKRPNEERWKSK